MLDLDFKAKESLILAHGSRFFIGNLNKRALVKIIEG